MPDVSHRGGIRPVIYLYNYTRGTEEALYISDPDGSKYDLWI